MQEITEVSVNNPSGMSKAELELLSLGMKPLPRGQKDRGGSKARFDRSKERSKNRKAKKSRRRNRRK